MTKQRRESWQVCIHEWNEVKARVRHCEVLSSKCCTTKSGQTLIIGRLSHCRGTIGKTSTSGHCRFIVGRLCCHARPKGRSQRRPLGSFSAGFLRTMNVVCVSTNRSE